jgi:hypothetical protein
MKKLLFFILLSVSSITFSGFGFGDNPKAIYAKEGRKLKIQSHSHVQKSKIELAEKVAIPTLENDEEIDEAKTTLISKIFTTFKFILFEIYSLIFR